MPGWDSLEVVARVHGVFEIVGLVLLALLVSGGMAAYLWLRGGGLPDQFVFAGVRLRGDLLAAAVAAAVAALVGAEIVAFGYGWRKDALARAALTAQSEQLRRHSEDAQRRSGDGAQMQAELLRLRQALAAAESRLAEARAAGELRRDAEVSRLQRKLADAETRLAALERHRRLTEHERHALIEAIKPYAGQKVTVAAILGDDEGKVFAEDIVAALDAAGWEHDGEGGISYRQWDRDPIGIELTLNEADARAGRIAPGVGALINVMRALGLSRGNTIYMTSELAAGEVMLKVGRKLRK